MLVCSRCGSQSTVPDYEYVVGQGWTWYLKCYKCGSMKFVEREGTATKEAQPAQEAASSPMTVLKKEERMTRKKCSYPGCDKGSWLKGLCHKHYIEKYGEYVPAKKGNGVVLPKEEPRVRVKPEAIERAVAEGRITPEKGAQLRNESHNKAVEEFAYQVNPPEPEKSEPAQHCPNLALYIPDELYAKIVQLAEQEYRPVGMQIQYLLHKGMGNG